MQISRSFTGASWGGGVRTSAVEVLVVTQACAVKLLSSVPGSATVGRNVVSLHQHLENKAPARLLLLEFKKKKKKSPLIVRGRSCANLNRDSSIFIFEAKSSVAEHKDFNPPPLQLVSGSITCMCN